MCSFRGFYANRGNGTEQLSSDAGPSGATRTRGFLLPNGCSNLVLLGLELHLALFSPENLLSGALFSAVSAPSGGGCGQTCGRIENAPVECGRFAAPRERCINALRVCIGRPADS